jgi:tetratricopeptide (TPR) repeat protein
MKNLVFNFGERQKHRVAAGVSRIALAAFVIFAVSATGNAQEYQSASPVFDVTNYTIDASIYPSTHTITAKAQIQVVPVVQTTSLRFKLNSALKVTSAEGPGNPNIQFSQQGVVLSLNLIHPLPPQQPSVLTVEYSGALETADGSPEQGLMLSYIGSGDSYLLYPGCWFPVNGGGLNRFSATLNLTVPAGLTVIASGEASPPTQTADGWVYSFSYDRLSFPGTVFIGHYTALPTSSTGVAITMYLNNDLLQYRSSYAAAAESILAYFASQFGTLPTHRLALVEMPNSTLGGYSGPGVVGIARRGFTNPVDYELLAHEISHQWWPDLVSPSTANDEFLDDGLATYSSALYIQAGDGETAFEDRMHTIAIDALIHEGETPIAQAAQLQPYSPEYESIIFDKGAMVFHMLRWVIGDAAFSDTLREMTRQYAWKAISTSEFQKLAEQASKQSLTYFFAQWVDSTGVPQFHRTWAIYKTQTGYQVVGKLQQDLDIFRMPVEIRVYVRGGPDVNDKLLMEGTAANFTINTQAQPVQVVVDPASDILKYTNKTRMEVEMASANQLTQATEFFAAIDQYRKVLAQNQNDSLAHYRIGDILFTLHNYNASIEEFQAALNGDLQPKWVEVWSYLKIGEIFDATGQRDRAMNEYDRALHTNDDTQGALDLAREYLKKPFTQPSNQVSTEAANGN